MSAQFRAPDPVRAHLNTALNASAVRPPAARISPAGPSADPRLPVARRALASSAIALAAPAIAVVALIGLGAASGGGLGGDLASLQGAVGVEGSASTGTLTGGGFTDLDDEERERPYKEKDRDARHAPQPRDEPAPKHDAPDPAGVTPGGKAPPRPVRVPAPVPDDAVDDVDDTPAVPAPGDDESAPGEDDSSGGSDSGGSSGSGGSGGPSGPVAQTAYSAPSG